MSGPAWVWLDPADVTAWLVGTFPGIATDQSIIADVCAGAEPHVERARPDMWVEITDPDNPDDFVAEYQPDGEVYTAARMLAARLYVRRNSSAGVEVFTGAGATMASYEPDIQRALHTGPWRRVVAM